METFTIGPALASAHAGAGMLGAQTRLLVVAPHPDDETIGTGLLIGQVLAAGGQVHVVLLTAGDNNPWPQRWIERRWRIGADDRLRWGRRRQAEQREAIARLGLGDGAVTALGLPDMGVADALMAPDGGALAALESAIDRFAPSLIAAPSLHDRHPDHGAAHVLVRLALARRAEPPRLLTYLVHGSPAEAVAWRIDASAVQRASKMAALEAHRTQTVLSGNRMRRLAGRPESFAEVVPASPSAEAALPWQPPRWLQPWLRLDAIDGHASHRWSWREAPLRRDADGRWRLEMPSAMAPRFVRLRAACSGPWIFDHWGWCEPGAASPALAQNRRSD